MVTVYTDKTFWRRLFGGRLRQLCRHQLNIKFFPPTCYQRIHGVVELGRGERHYARNSLDQWLLILSCEMITVHVHMAVVNHKNLGGLINIHDLDNTMHR